MICSGLVDLFPNATQWAGAGTSRAGPLHRGMDQDLRLATRRAMTIAAITTTATMTTVQTTAVVDMCFLQLEFGLIGCFPTPESSQASQANTSSDWIVLLPQMQYSELLQSDVPRAPRVDNDGSMQITAANLSKRYGKKLVACR